jgi:chemotaxis protein CheD
MAIIDVDTGVVAAGAAGDVMRAAALGSCVAVALRDAGGPCGVLAHIMLPGSAPANAIEPTRYAEDAIDAAIALLGPETRPMAAVAGAGNVLSDHDDMICSRNAASVLDLLAARNVPVCFSDLGGTDRRSLSLDVSTGEVHVSTGNHPAELVCIIGKQERRQSE